MIWEGWRMTHLRSQNLRRNDRSLPSTRDTSQPAWTSMLLSNWSEATRIINQDGCCPRGAESSHLKTHRRRQLWVVRELLISFLYTLHHQECKFRRMPKWGRSSLRRELGYFREKWRERSSSHLRRRRTRLKEEGIRRRRKAINHYQRSMRFQR